MEKKDQVLQLKSENQGGLILILWMIIFSTTLA
ncbi:hypothetical protein Goklo_021612, partial [Gossypium klotzschianum]|nr:hypothetical protein [Gossypium klotzschianum]